MTLLETVAQRMQQQHAVGQRIRYRPIHFFHLGSQVGLVAPIVYIFSGYTIITSLLFSAYFFGFLDQKRDQKRDPE